MSSSLEIEIAASPCGWGVDFADAPENPPWRAFLDEAAAAGYRLIEPGPVGYLPEDATLLGPELEQRGLRVAGGFMFADLHRPDRAADDLALAHRTAAVLAAMGASHLIVVPALTPERMAVAGNSALGRRLGARDQEALIGSLERIGSLARADYGLGALVHPHAGTFVEHRDEIERTLTAADPALVGLCADVGHLAYAGLDAVDVYRDHAGRCAYIHLKDIDGAVRARVLDEQLDFNTAVSGDIFCALERGVTDFVALRDALIERGFDGRLTVEQDLDPLRRDDAASNARHNLEYLRSISLADAGRQLFVSEGATSSSWSAAARAAVSTAVLT